MATRLGQQRAELRRLINGYQISQAPYVVTALEIADRLQQDAASSERLAAAVGADEQSLYRVLRALASVGVVEELPGRMFKLTPLGDGLVQRSAVACRLGCVGRPQVPLAGPIETPGRREERTEPVRVGIRNPRMELSGRSPR